MNARVPDRIGLWILLLATVIGIWLGLTAPSISPVDPSLVAGLP